MARSQPGGMTWKQSYGGRALNDLVLILRASRSTALPDRKNQHPRTMALSTSREARSLLSWY